jgi:imidazole glycerol-phosphate synthase subunit HisF
MKRIRIIPSLLIHNGGLVKSRKFSDYKYVGDPINAVKIFNEKEVDEICIIDIDASRLGKKPAVNKIAAIVSEAFMPVAYGGGINSLDDAKALFANGVEKVIINKAAVTKPELISTIAAQYGSQSMVVSIDVKKTFFNGQKLFTDNGRTNTGLNAVKFAMQMEEAGAGEILLNSIDRDGSFSGYDTALIREVSQAVNIPVIAIGGASSLDDFRAAVEAGASAVAAGSLFVFQLPHRAVLISYPSQKELRNKVFEKI